MNLNAKLKCICLLTFLLITYNEFLVYYFSYFKWPDRHDLNHQLRYAPTADDDQSNRNSQQRPLRILLVADPQLIGENDEPWYQSWPARWDCDRYLHNTYMLAHNYVRPDLVVFLGDLFDEGLKASDEQYERYFNRFRRVFKLTINNNKDALINSKNDGSNRVQQQQQQYVFLAGDNDIGGEYAGDRTDRLADRFEKFFGGSTLDLLDVNEKLRVVKLDLDNTVSFYNSIKRKQVKSLQAELDATKAATATGTKHQVILNHGSLIGRSKQELKAIFDDFKTNLVIKGDSHKSQITTYNWQSEKIEWSMVYEDDEKAMNFFIFQLRTIEKAEQLQSFTEISIPTCSYRMGVEKMGYGMMTITPAGKVYFSVLWLPSRFRALFNYLTLIFLVCFYFSLRFCCMNHHVRILRRCFYQKLHL